MKFEVDNTTQQLISELQGSIKNTISSVSESQQEIQDIIQNMRNDFSDVSTKGAVEEVKREVTSGTKKLYQYVTENLELIRGIQGTINTDKELLQESSRNTAEIKALQEKSYRKIEEISSDIRNNLSGIAKEEQINSILSSMQGYKALMETLENEYKSSKVDIIKSQKSVAAEIEGKFNDIQNYITEKSADIIGDLSANKKNCEKLGEQLLKLATQKDIEKQISDMKSEFNKLTKDIEEKSFSIIEKRLEDLSNKVEKNQNTLKEYESKLSLKIDDILACAKMIESIEKRNNSILEKVTKYLLLPGYKRFFKGMEEPYEEIEG